MGGGSVVSRGRLTPRTPAQVTSRARHTKLQPEIHTRLDTERRRYLAILDKGKALALYHTKRLASPAQRIVLYAITRGCTRRR